MDELVIHGGRVFSPATKSFQNLNIFIRDGLVLEVGARIPPSGIRKIDATEFCVVAGFIDLHTHLREPGFEHKEDIKSGGHAAAAGGFTTILCMPNTKPANDCASVTQFITDRARKVSPVRILPVGAMTKGLGGEELADFATMKKAGVIAISDDGRCVQDEKVIRRIFEEAGKLDLLVISHPENFSLSKDGIVNDGAVSKRLGLPGIPREAENNIIERDIRLAEETRARFHIAHVSTEEGISLVREAKRRGVKVSCEVTPHHILLTEEDVERLGANAKMNPPLRTEKDRLALIAGLKDGTVDAIATDHAPHLKEEKKDIRSAAPGVIGMETAFAVCMRLVEERQISLERLIELFTTGPAKVIGFTASLAAGAQADIVVFDPNASFTIDSGRFRSKSRNTPFDGWNVRGKILCTIAGGKIAYEA